MTALLVGLGSLIIFGTVYALYRIDRAYMTPEERKKADEKTREESFW